MALLNQEIEFDQVRWNTIRSISADWRESFQGTPRKQRLSAGTNLFRLIPMANGQYFHAQWWMPEETFRRIESANAGAAHGSGRLFRNYVAERMALPSGGTQLGVVQIRLRKPVYAWTGPTAPLFDRPGGLAQVFLPNLAIPGQPQFSEHASVVHTYWLKF